MKNKIVAKHCGIPFSEGEINTFRYIYLQSQQIADITGYSCRSIETHLTNLKAKLRAKTRVGTLWNGLAVGLTVDDSYLSK